MSERSAPGSGSRTQPPQEQETQRSFQANTAPNWQTPGSRPFSQGRESSSPRSRTPLPGPRGFTAPATALLPPPWPYPGAREVSDSSPSLCPSAPGGAKAVNTKASLLRRASEERGQPLQRPCGLTGCAGGKGRDEGGGGDRANAAPSQGSLPPALRKLTQRKPPLPGPGDGISVVPLHQNLAEQTHPRSPAGPPSPGLLSAAAALRQGPLSPRRAV